MSYLWKKRKSGECREKPFGNTEVLLQGMQKILHARPENAGISRRNSSAGNKNVLCRSQRTRRRQGVWLQQGKRVQLD